MHLHGELFAGCNPAFWLFKRSDLNIMFCFADNLAANFSRELADYIIYIIDVAGGDKIPRKGGPGITQADLLVRLLHFLFQACTRREDVQCFSCIVQEC